jgi:hypothetical protein
MQVNEDDRYTAAEARELGFSEEAFRLASRGGNLARGSYLLGQQALEREDAQRREREAAAAKARAEKRQRRNPDHGMSPGLGRATD